MLHVVDEFIDPKTLSIHLVQLRLQACTFRMARSAFMLTKVYASKLLNSPQKG